MEPIETLIVSDNRMVRESLVALLAATEFAVQHVATGAGMSLSELPPTRMALVVTDEEAAATVGQVAQALPDAKIVALALRDTEGLMVRSLQLGASAYLTENVSPDDLLKTLEIVIAGCAVLPFDSLGHLFPAGAQLPTSEPVSPLATLPKAAGAALARLSNREVNILEGLTMGDSNKVIARNLDIAEATVKVHVKAILRKIRVKNRTQAAVWAMNNRFLDGDQAEDSTVALRDASFALSGDERHLEASLAIA